MLGNFHKLKILKEIYLRVNGLFQTILKIKRSILYQTSKQLSTSCRTSSLHSYAFSEAQSIYHNSWLARHFHSALPL